MSNPSILQLCSHFKIYLEYNHFFPLSSASHHSLLPSPVNGLFSALQPHHSMAEHLPMTSLPTQSKNPSAFQSLILSPYAFLLTYSTSLSCYSSNGPSTVFCIVTPSAQNSLPQNICLAHTPPPFLKVSAQMSLSQ